MPHFECFKGRHYRLVALLRKTVEILVHAFINSHNSGINTNIPVPIKFRNLSPSKTLKLPLHFLKSLMCDSM